MTLEESAVSDLLDALRVGEGTDLVREIAQWALQALIDAEATEKIGAGHYERSGGRDLEVAASATMAARPGQPDGGDLAIRLRRAEGGSTTTMSSISQKSLAGVVGVG